MASLNLAPEELKQLELMRNRFQQLTSTLNTLMRDMQMTDPLPSEESIRTTAAILQQTVKSIQDLQNENAHLLQRLVIHPSTNYPGRTQEGPLLTLLRKKPDPGVERWAEDAREAARAAGIDASKLGGPKAEGGANAGLDEEDEDAYGYDPEAQGDSDIFNEQWADIRETCNMGIIEYIQNQANEPYTVAERAMGTHLVRTGLKRSLEEADEDEEESEEEDEERMDEDVVEIPKPGVGGAASRPQQLAAAAANDANKLHPEHMLWFMAKGDVNIPNNLDMEYLRKGAKETGKRAAPAR